MTTNPHHLNQREMKDAGFPVRQEDGRGGKPQKGNKDVRIN
jgi:hypothetical protein